MNGPDPNGHPPSPDSPPTSGPPAPAPSSRPTGEGAAPPPPRSPTAMVSAPPPASAAPTSTFGLPMPSIPGPLERAIAAAHRPTASALTAAVARAASASVAPSPPKAEASGAPVVAPAPHASTLVAAAAAASSAPPAIAAGATAAGIPASLLGPSKYRKRTKKYNNFNIFFMLERQLLLQSRGGGIDAIKNPINTSASPLVRHKKLHLPPLCRRYNHLPLTSNWFLELLANQNKKRPHRKSHGLIPFKELAQTVAKNYREIDDETQSFVNEVAERLGWHCEEVEAMEEKERIAREEQDRMRGAAHSAAATGGVLEADGRHPLAGRKRKDAPVVSVGGIRAGAASNNVDGLLSQDEAVTVRQLVGMKAESPPGATTAHAVAAAAAAHARGGPLPPGRRSFPSQVPRYPPPPMPTRANLEAEMLQVELARAMNARVESERRIQLLEHEMTRNRARSSVMAAHHHSSPHIPPNQPPPPPNLPISPRILSAMPPGYEHYLAMLAGGSTASRATAPQPKSPESQPKSSDMDMYEKELLKEALMRRIIPQAPPAAAAGAGPQLDQGLTGHLKRRGANSDADSEAEFKRSKSDEVEQLKREPEEVPRPSSAGAGTGDISFYKDLYSRLAPSQPLAPDDATLGRRPDSLAAAAAALSSGPYGAAAMAGERDMAMLDSLAARGLGSIGRPGAVTEAERRAWLATELARPPHAMPPSALDTYPPVSTARPHAGGAGSTYASLLSRLAAHHARSPAPLLAAPLPPPPAPGERQDLLDLVQAGASQFGLNHSEVMDVWRQMNHDNAGGEGKTPEE